MSGKIKYICTSFRHRQKNEHVVRILCFSYNIEKPQQNSLIVYKSRNKPLIVFDGVLYDVRHYTIAVSYRWSTRIMYQNNYILASDRIQNIKKISSQCNLTVEIESVQDTKMYVIHICTMIRALE